VGNTHVKSYVTKSGKKVKCHSRLKGDKYPCRPNSGMPVEILKKEYLMYADEYRKLSTGELTSPTRHRLFIARRLGQSINALKNIK
jgi:hypothetical protein